MARNTEKTIARRKENGNYGQIGRVGGVTTKQRMLAKDPNYYEKIGLDGANKLMETRGKDYFSRLGKLSRLRSRLKEQGA